MHEIEEELEDFCQDNNNKQVSAEAVNYME